MKRLLLLFSNNLFNNFFSYNLFSIKRCEETPLPTIHVVNPPYSDSTSVLHTSSAIMESTEEIRKLKIETVQLTLAETKAMAEAKAKEPDPSKRRDCTKIIRNLEFLL